MINSQNNSLWGKKRWGYWCVVVFLFLTGLGIRLFDLTDLPLDFHPTRQLRSAIIARGIFAQMQPFADEDKQTAVLQSMNSLEAYEPPIFETITAFTYRLAGGEYLWISRIYASLFWMVAALFLFLLLRRWNYQDGALIGLGIFLFAPFLVQASRSFQPDPFMVMWIAVLLYVLDRYIEKPTWKWAVISGLVGGMAVLVKVVAGLFVGPVLLLVLLSRFGLMDSVKSLKLWVMAGLVVLPPAIYYLVLLGGRSGGFFASWTVSFLHLLVDSSFYADWLHMLDSLFSLTLVVIALAGTFLYNRQPNRMVLGLWMGYILYGLISPFQFVTHTYYHLPMALLLMLGVTPIADVFLKSMRSATFISRTAVLILMLAVSGYYLYISRSVLVVDNFRAESIEWQQIGKVMPRDGSVIALTQDYGNRLMYFGLVKPAEYWPTTSGQNLSEAKGKGNKDFEDTYAKLTNGMRYFLVTALGQLDSQPDLKAKLSEYQVVNGGSGYILYDLTQPVLP